MVMGVCHTPGFVKKRVCKPKASGGAGVPTDSATECPETQRLFHLPVHYVRQIPEAEFCEPEASYNFEEGSSNYRWVLFILPSADHS